MNRPKIRRPFTRGAHAEPRPCRRCGTSFRPKQADRATFCGRDCAFAHRRELAIVTEVRVEAERRQRTTCRVCGGAVAGRARRFCSDECRNEQARRAARDRFVSVRDTSPVETKTCAHCGDAFDVNYHAARRIFCSARCLRLHGKANRRDRIRDVRVAPVRRAEIIERDRGLCQLCGDPVALEQRVPHPLAPTLDHVVPLARGGTHEPANVQLAHFICNSRKADGPALPGRQVEELQPFTPGPCAQANAHGREIETVFCPGVDRAGR